MGIITLLARFLDPLNEAKRLFNYLRISTVCVYLAESDRLIPFLPLPWPTSRALTQDHEGAGKAQTHLICMGVAILYENGPWCRARQVVCMGGVLLGTHI